MHIPIWNYRAVCTKVIDGDTLDVVIDTGFRTTRQERIRLLGVDTPELRAQDADERKRAQEAKEFVAGWVAGMQTMEWPLLIETQKGDSFGRWLARVTDHTGQKDLARTIIDHGLGVEYTG